MALANIANKTHWFGVFLLLVSSILLLIVTISAPVWNHVGLLHVTLPATSGLKHTSVNLGTFGYCIVDIAPNDNDYCTHHHIGYAPAALLAQLDHASISTIASGTSDSLTRVMVLHPIETGLSFIAFLLAIGHGIIGSLAGAIIAFITWILVLISLAIDFSLFGILHHHVNNDGSGSRARFGAAIWCLVAAFLTLSFGMIIVFFTCCANHREKKRVAKSEREVEPVQEAPKRKKKFGVF
ncbi:uncharacterized protein LTR77_000769 [Saxophila tyrrhenica]|uniref:Pali-domain-containing protein n=1 Tax=Saxophila tyrrhenica TaxID=1690608 RepID=A0AAV9PS97_9PEZI|nr:hypothetical protein LTR77_000769 [Saxophila tyrrhenica]